MRASIQRQLDRLNTRSHALLDLLSAVPPEFMNYRSDPQAWTALQALNHIFLGERLSLQCVKHKLSKGSPFPVLRPDAWIRTRALLLILRSRWKFKSPAPINMYDGQPVLSVAELRVAWDQLRMELADLLEQHEHLLRFRMAYKQPYAGRMTLSQMLCFFREHLRHHERQIGEILEKSGYRRNPRQRIP